MTAKKNRIGISLRSKSEWETAWNEELLSNKNTGEVLVKSYDGNPISYMYLSRLDQHIDIFSDKILDMGMDGELYMIDNESTNILPERIGFGVNILEDAVKLGSNEIKKIMLSLSFNSFISKDLRVKYLDIPIKYTIDIYNGETIVHTFDDTLSNEEMLTNIIDINALGINYDKIVLRHISMEKPSEDAIYNEAINIVYGLLIFVVGGER